MTGALSPCPDLACTLPWGSPLGGKGLRGWAGLLGSSLPRSRGDLPPGVLSNVPSPQLVPGPTGPVDSGHGARGPEEARPLVQPGANASPPPARGPSVCALTLCSSSLSRLPHLPARRLFQVRRLGSGKHEFSPGG